MSDHPHGGGGGRGPGRGNLPDRPKSKNYATLRRTWDFMKPYRVKLVFAAIALVVTSLSTLSIGVGLKYVIDQGLSAENSAMLDQGLLLMVGVILVISIGTYFRFYYVSWVGERVVADLRNAVFSQVLRLSPGFYEVTKTGEILSRLTSDTAVLQTVIGSSLSIALRNGLSLIGGVTMLLITNAQLTGIVALVVPAVIVPIIWYGRRVRKLSRESQDRIADVGAYGEEALNAIRTVQAYTHEDIDRGRFTKEVEGAFSVAMKRIFARGMLGSIVILLVLDRKSTRLNSSHT